MGRIERLPNYAVATFATLGMLWLGVAAGLRIGIGTLLTEGCPRRIVGEPTVCQSAIQSMNGHTELAIGLGVASLAIAAVTTYLIRRWHGSHNG